MGTVTEPNDDDDGEVANDVFATTVAPESGAAGQEIDETFCG